MWPAPCSAAPPRATGRFRACAARCAASRSCSTTARSARSPKTAKEPAEQPATRRLGLDQRPHGIPCVSGERRSNAQQYLGSAGPDHGGRCRRGLAHREPTVAACPYVGSGRLHRHRGHQRPGSRRPDSRQRRPGDVQLGQQVSTAKPSPPSMCSPVPRSPSTSKSRSPSTSIPKAAKSITAQEKAMDSRILT